jgi:hypothetical protein
MKRFMHPAAAFRRELPEAAAMVTFASPGRASPEPALPSSRPNADRSV